VDRICHNIEDEGNKIKVECEKYYSWIIDVSGASNSPSFLEKGLEGIKIVKDKNLFNLYVKRKKWLVNGIHSAIAVYALASEQPYALISDAIQDPKISLIIENIQEEFASALEICGNANINKIEQFNKEFLQRVKKNKGDKAARILRDLCKEDMIMKLKEIKDNFQTGNINEEQLLQRICSLFDYNTFFNKVKERIIKPINILIEKAKKFKFSCKLLIDLLLVIDKSMSLTIEAIKKEIIHIN